MTAPQTQSTLLPEGNPATTPAAQTFVFNNTTFSIIDHSGIPWLRANQIAAALGYADEAAIHRIYSRHADEFTEAMTGVLTSSPCYTP